MRRGLHFAFFGSSLLSAYWNGAATYYRGIVRELSRLGHWVTFYEPDAFDRQAHRDISDPDWATVVVYPATLEGVERSLTMSRRADVVIKASGVGVFDELLEQQVLNRRGHHQAVVFWDVDAPATLERMHTNENDPLRPLIPQYDMVLTYGGGPRVVKAYEDLGARSCIPIYNAVDPETHHPCRPDPRFAGTLSFLGNRMPDREQRVHEFFFRAAERLPKEMFLLGGSGWEQNAPQLSNIRYIGHVFSRDHNAFNVTPRAVLNINRESMARFGYSPATRVFEAAGAGACLISDAWEGLEEFLEPDREVLVAQDGAQVAEHLENLTDGRRRSLGEAALRRVLAEHTYGHRARQLSEIFTSNPAQREAIPMRGR